MLTKYDTTKQKRIWYYTDDVSKFSNDIANKEHQIEVLASLISNWLQEVIINNKGDIVPSKITNYTNYKNSYLWENNNSNIHATFVGGDLINNYKSGLLCFTTYDNTADNRSSRGFVKVTILDT